MARPTGVVSLADSLPNIPAATPPPQQPVAQDTLPVQAELHAQDSVPPDGQPGPLPGTPGAADPAYVTAPLEPVEVVVAVTGVDPAAVPSEDETVVADIKDVTAERLPKALSLDIVKRTETSGNAILEMSVAQRSAYEREVSEVQEKVRGAERAYVLAQWYMGQAASKLQRDVKEHGGTTYGQATVEGFAHDLGRDKSTVYKAIKLAKNLSFGHAQALTISVEAFQVIQKAPDKIRDWVLDEIVKRCKSGQIFGTEQVERVVETLTWYPSLTAQADKPAEVQKALDALMAWDPKALPGKDKPVFDLDAAKKAISAAAPDLLPVVKADEKSAVKAEKAKREQPGLNSKTGTSHVGVAKAFSKALDTIIEKAGSLTISIKECTEDGELTDKAYDNFAEIVEKINDDASNAIEVLEGIKQAADSILEVAEEKPSKGPKKKAKPRGNKKKK